ncbi:MAG: aminotransferase class IV [Maricaulaceae bacterium]
MTDWAWIGGRVVPADHIVAHADDRGLTLGVGVFETIRVRHGAPLRWDAHQTRLLAGLTALGVPPPTALAHARTGMAALASRAGLSDAVARLSVSAGPGPRGLNPPSVRHSWAWMTLAPRPHPPTAVRLASVSVPRHPDAPSCRYKTLSYGDGVVARAQAAASGADWGLMRGPDGAVAGADCANVFWFDGDVLYTPSRRTGALAGVTRLAILKAARAWRWPVRIGRFSADALKAGRDVFVSNTVIGVAPVVTIDDAPTDQSALERLARLRTHLEAA